MAATDVPVVLEIEKEGLRPRPNVRILVNSRSLLY